MGDNNPPIQQCEHSDLTILGTLRDRVRRNIEQGAVTDRKPDRETLLRMLNEGLAAEIACLHHCRSRHYAYMMLATSSHASSVAAACVEHGSEEQVHADRIAQRIQQLGGEPDLDPGRLSAQSYAHCVESQDSVVMIREDLVAEQNVIEGYKEMIDFLGDEDPATRCMLLDILADEERHAEALVRLLHAQGS